MLTVVPFPSPTPQSEALREALEACLKQAALGDVTAFVLVTIKRDGSILRANGRGDDADVFKLLGVLEHESRHLSHIIDAQNKITNHLEDDPAGTVSVWKLNPVLSRLAR